MDAHAHSQIEHDLQRLVTSLPHRAPNTESEHAAAEYLQERFSEYTGDTQLEEFDSCESWMLIAGSYYAEFAIVSLLAFWFPWVAAVYGVIVFGLYLAEFTGYRALRRLLPQYASQNVVARFMAARPERTCVVLANYDTPLVTPLTQEPDWRWLRPVHTLIVVSMAAIIASCVVQGAGVYEDSPVPIVLAVRWFFLAVLVGAAATLIYNEFNSDYGPAGAANAAGTAALLQLARTLSEQPIARTEVILAATGSKEAGLNGVRELLRVHRFDPHDTYFINLEHIDTGAIRPLSGEGLLATFRTPKRLLKAASEACQAEHGQGAALPPWRGWPTDALVPLAHGYPAVTLTGDTMRTPHAPDIPRGGPVPVERTRQVESTARVVVRIIEGMERVQS